MQSRMAAVSSGGFSMRITRALFCISALSCLSVPALSTKTSFELTEVSGKVLVTTKAGVSPAALGQQVFEGTRIFVGDEAVARVKSADGVCDIALPSQKVTVISYKKLCDVQITPTSSDYQPGGLSPPVVGLAFFGGVSAVVLYHIIRNDKDDPVSIP